MQFSVFLVDYLYVAGIIMSAIMAIILIAAWVGVNRISWVPVIYSFSAFFIFHFCAFVIMGPTLPPLPLYTWVGFFGGYLLLGLAYVQTFYELLKNKSG
jgi:hypothetical protein